MKTGTELLSELQARTRYGPIVGKCWLAESAHCVSIALPKDLGEGWINSASGLPVKKLYVNKDMAIPLLQALQNVRDRGLSQALKTYDGCFDVRDVRGAPGRLSTHAYALAIDINAETNALGTPGDLPIELVSCFIHAGFLWGGDFARSDPMHFQYAAW